MIILPRQDRDKHRENSNKDAFLQEKTSLELSFALFMLARNATEVCVLH
jgi:hypothetical protein